MLDTQQILQFETYLKDYKDDVYRVAYYYTKNKDDAEDLSQEAFMRAFRFFSKFRPDTNFKSWILKIMRNIYITNFNKNKNQVDIAKTSEEYENIGINLEDKMIDEMRINLIRESIQLLPDDFKEVILLCDIEGLSYEEIAKIIKIPVGTVRSRLHRGRLLLKERLLKKE
jgi:RNA polymerase sigma-70 factor (ECF subfamily)